MQNLSAVQIGTQIGNSQLGQHRLPGEVR